MMDKIISYAENIWYCIGMFYAVYAIYWIDKDDLKAIYGLLFAIFAMISLIANIIVFPRSRG